MKGQKRGENEFIINGIGRRLECIMTQDFQCIQGWGNERMKMGMGRIGVRFFKEGSKGDFLASPLRIIWY